MWFSGCLKKDGPFGFYGNCGGVLHTPCTSPRGPHRKPPMQNRKAARLPVSLASCPFPCQFGRLCCFSWILGKIFFMVVSCCVIVCLFGSGLPCREKSRKKVGEKFGCSEKPAYFCTRFRG